LIGILEKPMIIGAR